MVLLTPRILRSLPPIIKALSYRRLARAFVDKADWKDDQIVCGTLELLKDLGGETEAADDRRPRNRIIQTRRVRPRSSFPREPLPPEESNTNAAEVSDSNVKNEANDSDEPGEGETHAVLRLAHRKSN